MKGTERESRGGKRNGVERRGGERDEGGVLEGNRKQGTDLEEVEEKTLVEGWGRKKGKWWGQKGHGRKA